MRRHKTSVASLRGQLLFADMESGTLTLDCLLAKAGGTGSPVTFSARLPGLGHASELAIALLFQWAAEGTPIEVRITEGRTGPHVEIESSTRLVVLESDETQDA
jgi:hypothetical protein